MLFPTCVLVCTCETISNLVMIVIALFVLQGMSGGQGGHSMDRNMGNQVTYANCNFYSLDTKHCFRYIYTGTTVNLSDSWTVSLCAYVAT